MRNWSIRRVLIFTVLLSSGCGGGGEPSGPGEQVVFVSHRTGQYDLYTMAPGGAGQRAVAANAADDIAPALSPDGSKVVFLTRRYGAVNQLAMLDLASGVVTRVLTDTFAYGRVDWSPDGQELVFARTVVSTGATTLWRAPATGAGLSPLGVTGFDPAWSPDGSTIAYATYTGTYAIRLFTLANSHDTLVASGTGRPAWSPNGQRLAFECLAVQSAICTVGANGTGLDTVVAAFTQFDPSWSPDGLWIIAARNIDNTGYYPNIEVVRFHPDGSGYQRLTVNGDNSGGAADRYPVWGAGTP